MDLLDGGDVSISVEKGPEAGTQQGTDLRGRAKLCWVRHLY